MTSPKSKVLLIHNIYSPHIEPVFRELGQRCDLTVLYCAERESNRNWQVDIKGYKYSFLKGSKIGFNGSDLFTLIINPSVISQIKDANPEIVVLSGWDLPTYWLAAFYCMWKKIPYIVWSGSTQYEKSWRRSISTWLVKIILSQASGYIAYGQRAKDYLISLGVSATNITIAYNGFNHDFYAKFNPAPDEIVSLKQKFHLQHKKVILFYGQLIDRKDPQLLLKAFPKIKSYQKDTSLIIAGSGYLKDELLKSIKESSIQDAWIIDDPGDSKIRDLLYISDVLVLPSNEEVWGLVVNQALAMGLPVVVSDKVGCGPDLVVENKNGSVFSAGNMTELVSSIQKALTLQINPIELKKYSTSRAKLCHPAQVSQRVYRSILKALHRPDQSKTLFKDYLSLPQIKDDCLLSFAQFPTIPFHIKRVYYIQNSKLGLARGYHAHIGTQQAFFCIQGSVDLILDDGNDRQAVSVSSPNQGVFIDKLVWHEMHNISEDAIMLVFASEFYDEKDYIRNYSDFLLYIQESSE